MEELEYLIVERTKEFCLQVESLRFSIDSVIYNPLVYAWEMHEQYLRRYLSRPLRTLLLGMNPGPFGMAQTGIPFGEVQAVKYFLKLDGQIGKPLFEHPARPVLGLQAKRSEVSGRRLWGLISDHYQSAEAFSEDMGVINYCPLVFMDRGETARNITPDKLPKVERLALETICDRYLLDIIEAIHPTYLIGVGLYALQKLERVSMGREGVVIGSIPHPSPANPQANKGWAELTRQQLTDLGVWM